MTLEKLREMIFPDCDGFGGTAGLTSSLASSASFSAYALPSSSLSSLSSLPRADSVSSSSRSADCRASICACCKLCLVVLPPVALTIGFGGGLAGGFVTVAIASVDESDVRLSSDEVTYSSLWQACW